VSITILLPSEPAYASASSIVRHGKCFIKQIRVGCD
jgi:hypothetical protein